MTIFGQSNGSSQQENVAIDMDSTILAKTTLLFEKELKGDTIFQITAITGTITASATIDGINYRDVYLKKLDSATPETLIANANAVGIYQIYGNINNVKLTIAAGTAAGRITSNYN